MFDGMRFTNANLWEVFVRGKYIGSYPRESTAIAEWKKELAKYCSECREKKPVEEYWVFYPEHIKGWTRILCLECKEKIVPKASRIVLKK